MSHFLASSSRILGGARGWWPGMWSCMHRTAHCDTQRTASPMLRCGCACAWVCGCPPAGDAIVVPCPAPVLLFSSGSAGPMCLSAAAGTQQRQHPLDWLDPVLCLWGIWGWGPRGSAGKSVGVFGIKHGLEEGHAGRAHATRVMYTAFRMHPRVPCTHFQSRAARQSMLAGGDGMEIRNGSPTRHGALARAVGPLPVRPCMCGWVLGDASQYRWIGCCNDRSNESNRVATWGLGLDQGTREGSRLG